ncbi:MAG: hypothetical protein EP318_03165 [Rhodobacteraceae bacterium]|nr:MAG: hypothetical protein EP318_03165 [Paracoccaceae bacterium]
MTTQTTAQATRGPGDAMPAAGLLDRWAVLQLVKDSAPLTGIREREISILAAHLSVLPKGRLDPRQMLVSYAQVSGILERANCMDERRFRRGEARLEELGFVTRKLSGNGRRFPVRDGKGRVIDAYGIDLAPLFSRVHALQVALQDHRDAQARTRALRSRISACLSAVKRRALEDLGKIPDALGQQLARYRNLIRRRTLTLEELGRIACEVEGLAGEDAPVSPDLPGQDAAGAVPDAAKMSADDSRSVRHIESPRKEITREAPGEADPRQAWARCKSLPEYYPETPKSVHAMAGALFEFLGFLGLGQGMKETVVSTFGLAKAVRVADYIAGRMNRISNPAGYVKQMISEYRKGNAVAAGTVRAPACCAV